MFSFDISLIKLTWSFHPYVDISHIPPYLLSKYSLSPYFLEISLSPFDVILGVDPAELVTLFY